MRISSKRCATKRLQACDSIVTRGSSPGTFASNARNRHDVLAIARDLDLEDVVVQTECRDDVRARCDRVVELHDPVFEPFRRKSQLVRRAHHALGLDTAHLPAFDSKSGELCADGCDGDHLSHGNVGRGRRDRERPVAADVDAADRQTVGVGVLLECDDLAGDDAGETRAAHDFFDGKSQRSETFGDLVRAGRQVDEFAKPADGRAHYRSARISIATA